MISNNFQERIKALENRKSTEQINKEDAYKLMAGYLSEIERIRIEDGVLRKDLAKDIKTSASYLTQVFRGDKPLNFFTLAKMIKALNVRFNVTAIRKEDKAQEKFISASALKPVTITSIDEEKTTMQSGAIVVTFKETTSDRANRFSYAK